LLDAALSKNTTSTYQKGLNSFHTFRSKFNLPLCWPPTVDQFINYIAYLHTNQVAYSTVKCYLCGISYQIQLEGGIDNTKTFIIRKMLEGFHRLTPSKDTRSPITLHILKQLLPILPAVCSDFYEATMFSTAFQLAFFALLRVSEFTFTNNNTPTLLSKNVSIHDSLISLTITGSKTDQYNRGTTLHIPLNSRTESLFQHMHKYLSIRPPAQSLFFCHLNTNPLTKYQFTSLLHRSIKFIGLDTSYFKSHSFRIGGATELYLQGVPEDEIKIRGRWKSDAFTSYIRI
jgi:hypothetical protein